MRKSIVFTFVLLMLSSVAAAQGELVGPEKGTFYFSRPEGKK